MMIEKKTTKEIIKWFDEEKSYAPNKFSNKVWISEESLLALCNKLQTMTLDWNAEFIVKELRKEISSQDKN